MTPLHLKFSELRTVILQFTRLECVHQAWITTRVCLASIR